MHFRVRTSLTERPGALAELATRCGDAGLNILGLQIFPELGRVTDELMLSAPRSWNAGMVQDLVLAAGGDKVSVERCGTHDLLDEPMRWLSAAQDVLSDPDLVRQVLERLLGPDPERWSPTEHARAAALVGVAEVAVGGIGRAETGITAVEYDETSNGVLARIGGRVVGSAAFQGVAPAEFAVQVAPAWRRLGIGSALLDGMLAHPAVGSVRELVLLAPADDEASVQMLCSSGRRARLKVTNGLLEARIAVPGVQPLPAPVTIGAAE